MQSLPVLPSATFLLAAILLAIAPGPGIAYVVARTIAGGKAEGLASCMGTAVGGMVHVLAVTLGLSLLFAQSALAYAALKYLGAAYLIYLGIRMLAAPATPAQSPATARIGPGRALRDGIIVEVLNIKTAMFFLAFIPQFIATGHAVAPQFALFGTVCVALNTAVDLLAVAAANRLVVSSAAKAARERLLSRISGVTMLVLGVFVAVTGRAQFA